MKLIIHYRILMNNAVVEFPTHKIIRIQARWFAHSQYQRTKENSKNLLYMASPYIEEIKKHIESGKKIKVLIVTSNSSFKSLKINWQARHTYVKAFNDTLWFNLPDKCFFKWTNKYWSYYIILYNES